MHPKYGTVPHGPPDDPVTGVVLPELPESGEWLVLVVQLSSLRVDLQIKPHDVVSVSAELTLVAVHLVQSLL